mmetsp:Transcript_11233/g.19798  ORF Transcript_11233/g.19798 Transcript_11233/m.19798 type:complete len:82 (-) Transcript_11233:1856-2101(-)
MPSETLSRALVASSRMRILGSRSMARAIAIRCFCPPLMVLPASPTKVSKPSGCSMMKSYALAALAAASISASEGTWPGTDP